MNLSGYRGDLTPSRPSNDPKSKEKTDVESGVLLLALAEVESDERVGGATRRRRSSSS